VKSYDVDMAVFVNVLLPDDCDPDTDEGYAVLHEAAKAKFLERLQKDDVTFYWELYEDDDIEEDSTV
jgi:hypothetical protein